MGFRNCMPGFDIGIDRDNRHLGFGIDTDIDTGIGNRRMRGSRSCSLMGFRRSNHSLPGQVWGKDIGIGTDTDIGTGTGTGIHTDIGIHIGTDIRIHTDIGTDTDNNKYHHNSLSGGYSPG